MHIKIFADLLKTQTVIWHHTDCLQSTIKCGFEQFEPYILPIWFQRHYKFQKKNYLKLKSISFKNDLRNSEATKIYLILPWYFVYKKFQYLVRSTSKDKETQIKKYFLATPTPLSRPPPLRNSQNP